MYKALCGFTDYEEDSENGKIVCTLIGCETCKHYKNGRIYYKSDVPKAMSLWAKEKLKEINNEK